MKDETGSADGGGGIGLAALLGVVFIVLKLTGNITWPWLWVLAPFWIGIVVALAVWLAVAVLAVLAFVVVLIRNHLIKK